MLIVNSLEFYNHPILENYLGSKNGDIYSLISKKILSKNKTNGNGYLIFSFYNKEKNKYQNYYHHRFIYEVFNGLIPKCKQVDHYDTIKNNNRIKNLQLLTPKENTQKSNNKAIIATCLDTGEEKKFNSIKNASKDLDINDTYISKICKNVNKTAKSKKDGMKYTFRYD